MRQYFVWFATLLILPLPVLEQKQEDDAEAYCAAGCYADFGCSGKAAAFTAVAAGAQRYFRGVIDVDDLFRS